MIKQAEVFYRYPKHSLEEGFESELFKAITKIKGIYSLVYVMFF